MSTDMAVTYALDDRGRYVFAEPPEEGDILALATKILEQRMQKGDALTCPADTKRYLTVALGHLEQEVFACLFLNNRHQVISFDTLFYGTIDGASVHPREVVKRAIAHNAAAIIAAHNHPSGVAEPSQADLMLTRRLRDSLGLVDIRLLDHIVVGGADTVSLADCGLI